MNRCGAFLAVLWFCGPAGSEEPPRYVLEHARPHKAEVAIESDYSGKADTGFPAARHDVSAWASRIHALYFPEVKSNLHLRVGGAWERWTSDTDAATVPSKLQSAYAVLGYDWRISRKWDMRFEIRPGLYGDFSDVHGGTVNAPFIAGVTYFLNPRLHLLSGFMVNPQNDARFFPFVGARWQFADKWTLDFVAPRPRVRYKATDQLSLWTGLEIRGGTFRVARDFGTRSGDFRLNDDRLQIREYRAGGGADWKWTPFVSLEASGGYVIERRLHYQEADVTYYSKGAPYVQVSFRLRLPR